MKSLGLQETIIVSDAFLQFLKLFLIYILQFIPDAISKLKKLEELDLSSNSLDSLPDSIGMLLNLRILNVTSNNLTSLPESIAHCRFVFLSFLVNVLYIVLFLTRGFNDFPKLGHWLS